MFKIRQSKKVKVEVIIIVKSTLIIKVKSGKIKDKSMRGLSLG